jgi:hypothetical protein
MPVRDLTFRVPSMLAHGSKVNAAHFAEICGGNALKAAIGIVRLGGRATLYGPRRCRRELRPVHLREVSGMIQRWEPVFPHHMIMLDVLAWRSRSNMEIRR